MKKKWIKRIILLVLIVLLVGFGIYKLVSKNNKGIKSQVNEVTENLNAYHMEANMEFHNGDDLREYLVKVSYKKDGSTPLFRVSLFDKGVNQEQIIIRNKNGVYVLTPALNQVYKFKGDWPLNGAKPYLYQSMLDVFKGKYELSKLKDGYVITSSPNYKNSPNWTKQEMKMTSQLKPIWVHIYDKDNNIAVKVTFIKVEFDPTFADNYFEVSDNMTQARSELTTPTTSTINDLPLYPTNAIISATLKEQSVIQVGDMTQHILTYEGEEAFTVVQHILESYDEMVITEVSGELIEIAENVGILNTQQLIYEYNGVSYHIYSDKLTTSQLVELALGMEVVAEK